MEKEDVAAVVARAADGDAAAWEELVRRYGGLLRTVGAGFRLPPGDVEDAAQSTWLGLVQNVDRLRDPEGVAGWLTTTMRRNCLRLVRARQREQLRDDWTQWTVVDDSAAVEARILTTERDRILWETVDRLPRRQRQLVRILFATAEISYHRISTVLSVAIGTIGPARKRALRRLRSLLAERGVHR